ncbi:MAG: hypothetical protein M1812_000406 [Candelaria pacifica]|nr:MAG: hypothetical protein M1812_000406 [Candelaria pacifica]
MPQPRRPYSLPPRLMPLARGSFDGAQDAADIQLETIREVASLTTTALVYNLHCTSCVNYIREVLSSLGPALHSVHANILTLEVIVRHDPTISLDRICCTLLEAAFELHNAVTTDVYGRKLLEREFKSENEGLFEQAVDHLQGSSRARQSAARSHLLRRLHGQSKSRKHVENCEACQREERDELEKPSNRSSIQTCYTEKSTQELLYDPHKKPELPLKALVRDSASAFNNTLSSARAVLKAHSRYSKPLPPLPTDRASRYGPASVPSESKVADPFVVVGSSEKDPSKAASSEVPEQEVILSVGGMTCSSCTGAVTEGLNEISFVKTVNVNLLTNSATLRFLGAKAELDQIVEAAEDLGFECSVQEWHPIKLESRSHVKPTRSNAVTPPILTEYKATLSIEGMTCAVCTGTVTTKIQEFPWITSVNVNLLTNSASVTYKGPEDRVHEIIEKIDDLYDCTLESCSPLDTKHETRQDGFAQRTVMVYVEGTYCEHCPPRILEALQNSYAKKIVIDKAPTLRDPVVQVTYSPQTLTIREIISTISKIDPAFTARIHHPPTIEERSRAMQLHEQHRILLRLLLCFVVAIPTFLIGVVWMSLDKPSSSTRKFFEQPVWAGRATRTQWSLFILATPVMFFAADVFHIRAFKEIKAQWRKGSKIPILRRFYRFGSMNLLMSLGTGIAYFSSLTMLIIAASSKSPEPTMGHEQSTSQDNYFDSVVFLTVFILIGRFIEAYSKAKTGDAVTMLGNLRPSEAVLVTQKGSRGSVASTTSADSLEKKGSVSATEKVNVDLLETGDIVLVSHGASPPADGILVSGDTQFDESSLTGESRPVRKVTGDKVFAGAVNVGKPTEIEVTEINGTSMLDQIVAVVREGQTKRAPVERVADILTGYFVPVITLIAIITFVTWLGLGLGGVLPDDYRDAKSGGWPFWALQFAIAVFVVACPCGIGLAAPTALFVGGGLAAQHGILVKGGGEAFQEASQLDVVVFDKTGTLTKGGDMKVSDHHIANKPTSTIIWAIVKALEETSSHPIAKAMVDICHTKKQATILEADVEEVAGRGLRGTFTLAEADVKAKYQAVIGNEAFMTSLGVEMNGSCTTNIEKWKREGKSVALLAIKTLAIPNSATSDSFKLAAQFATADPLRPEATHVIRKLREGGIGVYMLTGDNATTARAVGEQVGIPPNNIIAGVMPSEKADKLRWLQANASKRHSHTRKQGENAIVAMLGDGINDSPALTTANVSIAIGSGSDIAISSSSFILLTSNLTTLLTLIELSKTVFRRVKLNFAWALVYNVAMLPVAAGVLYPLNGHPRLAPVWASLAMALSSVSVICSSLALRLKVPGVGFRGSKIEWDGKGKS